MPSIPILSGIYANEDSDFRTSYPRNLVPVPKVQGISKGYLRPSDGIELFTSGPGVDRGSINWQGVCYRVMGTKLVSVASNGVVTELGDVGGSGQVTMDYSFDRLGIASSGNFFYWDGTSLDQVTDPDLGFILDFIWVDGYFMLTDGEFIIVTDLNDPFSINPLRYGSSEADPDPILALVKIRNEPVALNRHTIEYFDNIRASQGGVAQFPFQRIDGAQIKKGCVGTFACAVYNEGVAFVGSGRGNGGGEAPAVYFGNNGSYQKISTREIDQILKEYTEAQLAQIVCEVSIEDGFNHLHIRLPDRTLVFASNSSEEVGGFVWFTLSGGIEGNSVYPAINRTWCYDRWIVGDPNSSNLGTLSKRISSQWGEEIGHEFTTGIIYNQSKNGIVHSLELIGLPGRALLGDNPTIYTVYSTDGVTQSQPKFISAGKQGQRDKRLEWRRQGFFRLWRTQTFKWTSKAHLSIAALEASIEPLAF